MTWTLKANNGQTRSFDTRPEAEQAKHEIEQTLDMGVELYPPNADVAEETDETETVEVQTPDGETVELPENAVEKLSEEEATDLATNLNVIDERIAETTTGFSVDRVEEVLEDLDDVDTRVADPDEDFEQASDIEPSANGRDELPDSTNVGEDPISWMPEHFVDVIEGVPAINRKGYAVLAEHYGISTIAEPITYPSESEFEYAEFRAIATTPNGNQYSGFGSAHVERGDDKTLLGELAETRAIKRAIASATGIGMIAVEELSNEVSV